MEIARSQILSALEFYAFSIIIHYPKSDFFSKKQRELAKKAYAIHCYFVFFGVDLPCNIGETEYKKRNIDIFNNYVNNFQNTPVEQAAEELFNQIYK